MLHGQVIGVKKGMSDNRCTKMAAGWGFLATPIPILKPTVLALYMLNYEVFSTDAGVS